MSGSGHSAEPFIFYSRLSVPRYTGLKIRDVAGLVRALETISDSALYYHTYYFFLRHQSLIHDQLTEFAYWVMHSLQEEQLGYALSSVDIFQHVSMQGLRHHLLKTIQQFVYRSKHVSVAPPGEELHIVELSSYQFSTGNRAHTIDEFVACLQAISIDSVYFHMVDARFRLRQLTNDFAQWFEHSLQDRELARLCAGIDLSLYDFKGVRSHLCQIIHQRMQQSREFANELA
jgi:hypothetical protein